MRPQTAELVKKLTDEELLDIVANHGPTNPDMADACMVEFLNREEPDGTMIVDLEEEDELEESDEK